MQKWQISFLARCLLNGNFKPAEASVGLELLRAALSKSLLKIGLMALPFTTQVAFALPPTLSPTTTPILAMNDVNEELPTSDGLDTEVLNGETLDGEIPNGKATSQTTPVPIADSTEQAQYSVLHPHARQQAKSPSVATQNIALNAISPQTLATFVELINTIRTQYLSPVNDEMLFVQAMRGMLKGLDPYSELLDRQQYDDLQAITQGGLGQVGIDVVYHDELDNWVVEAVVPDSSAAHQGIKVGDYVHAIDELKLTKMVRPDDVKAKLTGIMGSSVQMTISAAGRQKRHVNLERSVGTDASLSVTWQDGIAIVDIPVFQEVSRQQLIEKLLDYPSPVRGVVLDVRNNPGGVLESAVAIVSLFQNNQNPIAYIEDRQGIKEVFYPTGQAILAGLPVVVLQNRYSASASEVLASSLKNAATAIVMGELSYGKGSVQSVFELNQDYAIKLTVAHYLDANRQDIDGKGIMPDVALLPPPATSSSNQIADTFTPKPFDAKNVITNDRWLQQAFRWVTGQSLNDEWTDTNYPTTQKAWQTDFPNGIRLSGLSSPISDIANP